MLRLNINGKIFTILEPHIILTDENLSIENIDNLIKEYGKNNIENIQIIKKLDLNSTKLAFLYMSKINNIINSYDNSPYNNISSYTSSLDFKDIDTIINNIPFEDQPQGKEIKLIINEIKKINEFNKKIKQENNNYKLINNNNIARIFQSFMEFNPELYKDETRLNNILFIN